MKSIRFMLAFFLILTIQFSYATNIVHILGLHRAIREENTEKALECLNAIGDVGHVDSQTLYRASKRCLIDVVNAMVKRGINPNKIFSPCSFCTASKHQEKCSTWLDEQDVGSTPLLLICKNLEEKKNGDPISRRTQRLHSQGTAHYRFVDDDCESRPRYFRDQPIAHSLFCDDINCKGCESQHGTNPNEYHIVHGIAKLIQHGADPNISDSKGNTPLHYITRYATAEELAATKMLLQNGANPLIRNHNRETPRQNIYFSQFHYDYKPYVLYLLDMGEKNWTECIKRCSRTALRGTTKPSKRKVKKRKPTSAYSTHLLEKPLPKWNGCK